MKANRLLGITATLIMVAGTAGAQTTVFYPGVLRHQYWTSDNPNGVKSPSRVQVEQGQAGDPATDTYDLTIWDTNAGGAPNYSERVSGLFIPAVTTNYVFWVNSDDDSDLFVSTDATASNKRLVAQEVGWSNVDQWHATGSGGGSTAAQKRSDQFSPDGTTHPFAKGIPMVAGQKYWIEGVHHNGTGGESFAATFSFLGGAEPTDGVKSSLSVTNIGYGYTIPNPLTVTTQATNATAGDNREATFTYVVVNPLPDPLVYQWYRNGAVLNGATNVQYTLLASAAADNNAQFQCVVSMPDSYTNSTTSTSAVAVLTVVNNSVLYTNGLKVERFNNVLRTDVENGNSGAANSIQVSIGSLSATPLNYAGAEVIANDGINNYGRRMSGWFLPPTTGQYVFFIASDDDADLFLSTDATAASKTLIAQENAWSASREWADPGTTNTASAGGSLLSQKRSDQWTNSVGDAPFTNGIALTQGTPYYIEAVSHQGGGGDNLGILAKLVADPDPTNGAPPIPPTQLALKSTPATNLTFVTVPKAANVFDANQALFTGSAKTDSEFDLLYQWQRNGTNIPGATTTSYSFTAIVADSGSTFDLVASVAEGGFSTALGGLSITSPPVTLTVQTAVFEPGLVLMQYWINKGADLTIPEAGNFGAPDFMMAVPRMEAGINGENGNGYVNELNGFFVPATSQAYDFIVTGDDHIDVFLSTDSSPNNKRLICQQPSWAGALAWDDGATPLPPATTGNPGNNSASDRNQMNSGTWTNASGVKLNPNGIQLTAGQKYYMEVWHQEGGGGDSVAVTMVKHGDPVPANGTDSSLTGSLIGFNAPNTSTFIRFTNQPVDATVISGQTATFTASGDSDDKIVVGTTGLFQTTGGVTGATNFVKFPNVLFQWYRNATLIPGATTSSYTTPLLKPGDSAQYYLAIRALGIANWSNSTIAQLTVIDDTNQPNVFAAFFDEGTSLIPTVSVSFDKIMDLSTITNINNYNIAGAQVTAVLVDTNDMRHVQLQLAVDPTTFPLVLTLTGITDFSGNPPVTSTVNANQTQLKNSDIGDFTVPDPGWPGYMYADGTNAYHISCEGSDIYNNADGFNFSFEQKTGDFDVVVRQKTFTKASNWSKGGLMVREDLTPGSREWCIVNDPTNADGQQAANGDGTGANTVESNARTTNGQATASWAVGPATVPAYPNAWVRLKRVNQVLSSYWSSNGVTWVQQGLADVSTNANGPLPSTVYVGICCTAHANDPQDATVLKLYYDASFDNYNSAFVASTNAPQATLSASISGGNVVISWAPAGGTLQSSPTLGAGAVWTTVGTANPATIPIVGIQATSEKFFRVGP